MTPNPPEVSDNHLKLNKSLGNQCTELTQMCMVVPSFCNFAFILYQFFKFYLKALIVMLNEMFVFFS